MSYARARCRSGVIHLLPLLFLLAIGLIVFGVLFTERNREPPSPPPPLPHVGEGSVAAAAKPQAAEAAERRPAAAKTRPAWIDAPPRVVGGAYQTSITIGPYTTRDECNAKLPDAFQEALDRYADVCLDENIGQVRLPNDYLRQQVVKDEWEETRQYSVGRMIHLHVLLQFDRQVKERILEAYRETIVAGRLWWTGGTLLAVWAILAVLYGYLKGAGRSAKPSLC